jgi:two-component system, NtrC family, sensor kinase
MSTESQASSYLQPSGRPQEEAIVSDTLAPEDSRVSSAVDSSLVTPIASRISNPGHAATLFWQYSPTPMVEWQLDGTMIDLNPAAISLFGIDQAIGQNLFHTLLTDANSLPLKTLFKTKRHKLKTLKTLHSHLNIEDPTGSPLLCEWHHTLLQISADSTGSSYRVTSFITDLTHYVQTKRQLQQSQQALHLQTETLQSTTQKYQDTLDQLLIAQSNCALAFQRAEGDDYQAAIEASADIMAIVNGQGVYEMILPSNPNPLIKLTAASIGQSIQDSLDSQHALTVRQALKRTLKTQQPQSLDYAISIGDRILWFNAILSPMGTARVLWVARNITDRKQTEDRLLASEQFLYQVLDALPDPVFVKDHNHRWKLVNQATCELMGHPKELMIGAVDNDLLPPDEVQQIREQDDLILTLGMDQVTEAYITDGAGKRHYVSTKRTALTDRHGQRFIVGTIRDLSDRKTMEDALRQSEARSRQQTLRLSHTLKTLQLAQTQLVQSEKMSSLGQLVAGVAHEINNPMNFIHGNVNYVRSYTQDLLGLLNLYQKHYPNPAMEIQDSIEVLDLDFVISDLTNVLRSMETGTERIQQIVRSLRIFSRMDEAEMKSVNIHEGLDSTLMLLDSRLKAKTPEIQVLCDYGNLPDIQCYAGQLNQVFMNVLMNAIDALNDLLKAETVECDRTIHISTLQIEDQQVEIRIRDTGAGMDDQIQQHLFDPFFTTKPVGQGTGMGLSICYQIITQQHGGQLICESTIGEGSEFVIQIPIALPPELQTADGMTPVSRFH